MQIPLELRLPLRAELKDFVAANKAEITAALNDFIAKDEHAFIYIQSSIASGKTHLLSSVCQQAEQSGQSVIYIPLKMAHDFTPEICDDLEQADIICIDDIDQVAGDKTWETSLFNLYNRIRDYNRKLLVSGRVNPAHLDISLPDLKSRLSWGMTLNLKSPDDDDKAMIMKQRASQLAMELPDETISYLFKHSGRSLHDLLAQLDELERASMAHQRKLTIPFVRQHIQ